MCVSIHNASNFSLFFSKAATTVFLLYNLLISKFFAIASYDFRSTIERHSKLQGYQLCILSINMATLFWLSTGFDVFLLNFLLKSTLRWNVNLIVMN
jgi:hypothetical protein